MNGDSTRGFVDSNILVYAYDKTAGTKFDKSSDLVETLWSTGGGCISIQVLQEFYVVATRKFAGQTPRREILDIVEDLCSWNVHSPVTADVLDAIRIRERYRLSFWDAMIIGSAVKLDCKILWSEDLNHGQDYLGVRVQNPFFDTSGPPA